MSQDIGNRVAGSMLGQVEGQARHHRCHRRGPYLLECVDFSLKFVDVSLGGKPVIASTWYLPAFRSYRNCSPTLRYPR